MRKRRQRCRAGSRRWWRSDRMPLVRVQVDGVRRWATHLRATSLAWMNSVERLAAPSCRAGCRGWRDARRRTSPSRRAADGHPPPLGMPSACRVRPLACRMHLGGDDCRCFLSQARWWRPAAELGARVSMLAAGGRRGVVGPPNAGAGAHDKPTGLRLSSRGARRAPFRFFCKTHMATVGVLVLPGRRA